MRRRPRDAARGRAFIEVRSELAMEEKIKSPSEDELRSEYDSRKMRIVARDAGPRTLFTNDGPRKEKCE